MRKQNFSEILLSYYEEVRGSIGDYFRHLMIFHLDNNIISRYNGNPLFVDVTSKPYDLSDYREYLIGHIKKIIDKADLRELLNTKAYDLLNRALLFMDEINIEDFIHSYPFPGFDDPEYHKICVVTAATNLCLNRGDISFIKALNYVCIAEKEGTPAYRQEHSEPNTDIIIGKLKEVKDFIISNDDRITS